MKAISDFTEAIRLNPNYAEAYNYRGNAIYDTLPPTRWSDALKDLDRAIAITPENAAFYANRGRIRSGMGAHEEAIADWSEALRRAAATAGKEGTFPDAYFARGREFETKGDIKAAIKDYEFALKYAPSDWWSRSQMEQALKDARSKQ